MHCHSSIFKMSKMSIWQNFNVLGKNDMKLQRIMLAIADFMPDDHSHRKVSWEKKLWTT